MVVPTERRFIVFLGFAAVVFVALGVD